MGLSFSQSTIGVTTILQRFSSEEKKNKTQKTDQVLSAVMTLGNIELARLWTATANVKMSLYSSISFIISFGCCFTRTLLHKIEQSSMTYVDKIFHTEY